MEPFGQLGNTHFLANLGQLDILATLILRAVSSASWFPWIQIKDSEQSSQGNVGVWPPLTERPDEEKDGVGRGSHWLEVNSRCGFFTIFLVSTRDLGHPSRVEKAGLGQLLGNVNGTELSPQW